MRRFHGKSSVATQQRAGGRKKGTHAPARGFKRTLLRVARLTVWVGLVWLAVVELAALCLLLAGGEIISGVEFLASVAGVVAGLTWLRGLLAAIAGTGPAVASSTQDEELACSITCSFSSINPASGLPMVSGGMDAGGNAYGTNSSDYGSDWSSSQDFGSTDPYPQVNPASGLPMIEHAGIDVAGNPFGTNNDWNASTFDNSWSSSSPDSGSSSFSSHNMFE